MKQRLPQDRRHPVVVEVLDPSRLRNLFDERRLEASSRAGAAVPARDLPVVVERPASKEEVTVPLESGVSGWG